MHVSWVNPIPFVRFAKIIPLEFDFCPSEASSVGYKKPTPTELCGCICQPVSATSNFNSNANSSAFAIVKTCPYFGTDRANRLINE